MSNTTFNREEVLQRLGDALISLKYVRDAFMHIFLNLPAKHFISLSGHITKDFDDQMVIIKKNFTFVDSSLLSEIKSFIVNTNDKDLAVKYVQLDLVVWQILAISDRVKEKHEVLKMAYECSVTLVYDIDLSYN